MRLNLLCSTFDLFLDHISYPVRQHVPKCLQCKNCWRFSHSLFVCRSDFTTCGKCGENDCEGDCEKDPESSLQRESCSREDNCPERVREAEIIRVRSKKRLKHDEEGKKCYDVRDTKEDESVRKHAEVCFC